MSYCFLVGSDERCLIVQRVVETISLDSLGQLDLTCDFFVDNPSDKPSRLTAIHRGDPSLSPANDEWLDRRSSVSRAVQELLRSMYGACEISRSDGGAVSIDDGGPPYGLAPEAQLSPQDLGDKTHEPVISVVTSDSVPAKSRRLFRIRGRFDTPAMAALLGDSPDIRIMGEQRLIDKIESMFAQHGDTQTGAQQFFSSFLQDSHTPAEQYHFLLDVGRRSVRPISGSLNRGWMRRRIRGRTYSWYWSIPRPGPISARTTTDASSLVLVIDRFPPELPSARRDEDDWNLPPVGAIAAPTLEAVTADVQYIDDTSALSGSSDLAVRRAET